MKISIVTVSYNQADFLEEAIRSVIDQDYKDLEYIVVDPGSTDGSRDIIERYRDRIEKIIYEPDEGPADGLNKGFLVATGQIFGFLNSDDLLEPGALSCVAKYFGSNSNMDVLSGHSLIIDAQGRVRRRFYSDRFSLGMAAYSACILSQASTFFRSDLFRRVGGFNKNNRVAWDGELFIDMALAGARFSLASQFWSKFRIHGESITGSGRLHKHYQLYRERMFRKIKGREYQFYDKQIEFGARYMRKILNMRDTVERLRYGPIYRSAT